MSAAEQLAEALEQMIACHDEAICPAVDVAREALAAYRAGQPPASDRVPLTEEQLVHCLNQSSCVGTVKMSFDSGPYEITRPSINADRLLRAIERAHGINPK